MTTAIATFGNSGLPSAETLSTALRQLPKEVGAGGVTILKMDKTGCWVFGTDSTDVEDGSRWAVNPFSFIHGFIAWGDGEVLAEHMTAINDPLPEVGQAPSGAEKGWEGQLGFMLKCMDGEDAGLTVRYTATSVGGKRAVQDIGKLIADQIDADPAHPVPIVTLDSEHYQHKKYGKIFTPVLEVVEWVGMDGLKDEVKDEEEAEVKAEPKPEPKTEEKAQSGRRTRRSSRG